jgi:hypothetical protein
MYANIPYVPWTPAVLLADTRTLHMLLLLLHLMLNLILINASHLFDGDKASYESE